MLAKVVGSTIANLMEGYCVRKTNLITDPALPCKQAAWRARQQRQVCKQLEQDMRKSCAATTIQAHWHGFRAMKHFQALRLAVLVSQHSVRGKQERLAFLRVSSCCTLGPGAMLDGFRTKGMREVLWNSNLVYSCSAKSSAGKLPQLPGSARSAATSTARISACQLCTRLGPVSSYRLEKEGFPRLSETE